MRQRGKPLWQFPINTVMARVADDLQFDKRQYVAIASGSNIIVFGLVE